MAISKKGSRKIVVEDNEFRWRAKGDDHGIDVSIWADENKNCIVTGFAGYHNKSEKTGEDSYTHSQAIVTNRIIKEMILHVGVKRMTENKETIHLGAIEKIYDFDDAVRSA